jgi:hypothetical protein
MSETAELVLVPEQEKVSETTFKNASEFDAFWQRLLRGVKPQLEKLAAARRASEEDAKRRHIK